MTKAMQNPEDPGRSRNALAKLTLILMNYEFSSAGGDPFVPKHPPAFDETADRNLKEILVAIERLWGHLRDEALQTYTANKLGHDNFFDLLYDLYKAQDTGEQSDYPRVRKTLAANWKDLFGDELSEGELDFACGPRDPEDDKGPRERAAYRLGKLLDRCSRQLYKVRSGDRMLLMPHFAYSNPLTGGPIPEWARLNAAIYFLRNVLGCPTKDISGWMEEMNSALVRKGVYEE